MTRPPATSPYWDTFSERLARARSREEALAVALSDLPGLREPTHRLFHTNLLFFLENVRVPQAVSADEIVAYSALVQRLHESGSVAAEDARHLRSLLEAALL